MRSGSGRILAGIVVVAIGVGFLMDTAGVIDFSDLASDWWPLIIVAAGIIQLATRTGAPSGAALMLVIGLVLLAWTLGFLPRNLWSYFWPIVIIVIGLAILFSRGTRASRSWSTHGVGTQQATSEADFERSVLFGGADLRVESTSFRGARVSATFGGLKLDLRGAKLAPEGATVEANATFGGIEIVVPRDWRVRVDGSGTFGGFDSHVAPASDVTSPLVVVKGSATFGGVEVKS